MHLLLRHHPRLVPADGPEQPLAAHAALLLAWLALEGPTPRARLAALLWPEQAEEAARNSLRQRLFRLRRQAGCDLVQGQATLALADGLQHDLDPGADGLLDGAELPVAGELALWLERQREQRRSPHRRGWLAEAEQAEQAQEWDRALALAHELLRLEPLSESAHRRLIRLHYLKGDRAAALLAFDRCEQLLKHEVGATPDAETLALLRHVQQAGADAVVAAAPLRRPALPASVLRPPRLVGRARELDALAAAWSEGLVVAVVGEAGLGKTHLLRAFAEPRGLHSGATARPGDAGVPYATLARLLRALLQAGPAEALPPAQRHELARVLPEFGSDAALALRTPGEGQRMALLRAVQALLQALAGPGVGLDTVLLDDLHFADTASLELLGHLVDGLEGGAAPAGAEPRLRWVLAYRPGEAGSPLQALHDRLAEQARLAPLRLAPLDEAALAELVDSLHLPGVQGARLAPLLARRTGGNPLFVLETLKQAWADGSLAQLHEARALAAPLSVGRLIERRLAQLSPPALALARVAAVAAPDFALELAAQVLGQPVMQFADALNELEAAHVMRDLQFAHDLVHDAVRASVPPAVARHTHAAVAAWLEVHGGEPARVAGHWQHAGQPARAIPWLARAAEAAGRAVRRLEQIRFLEAQSELEAAHGQPDAAFDTLLRAAELQVTVDEGDAGEQQCDRLDALARSAAQRVRARLQRVHRASMRGDLALAEQLGHDTLREALREGVDEALVVQCRHHLAMALVAACRPEALQQMEAMLPWVRAHAGAGFRCEFFGNLAIAYENAGRLADAHAQHLLAVAAAREAGEHGNLALTLANHGAHRMIAGHPADAEALLAQARLVRAQDDAAASIDAYVAMSQLVCDYAQGRYARALATLDEVESGLGRFAPAHRPFALTHRAVVWAQLGQWARLQSLFDEIDGADSPLAASGNFALRRVLLQEDQARAQGREPAPDALPRALAMAAAGCTLDMVALVQLVLLLREPGAGVRARAEAALDHLRREGQHGALLGGLARAARRAAREGDGAASRRLAGEALALTAAGVMPPREYPLEPVRHLVLAALERGEPEAARPLLREALAWLQARLDQGDVPPACRDGFVERNPCNRGLRALAARLGLEPLTIG